MPGYSPERLQLARLYQEFGHQPVLDKTRCPVQAAEFALYPVRYALDESPAKGTPQGPNPLPRAWTDPGTPTLRTRSLTLRQLRDGWLYVWDEQAAELHEYQVSGRDFIRHEEGVPGEARPCLLYRRDRHLRMAFSPVRWSQRVRDGEQAKARMREVDLPLYARNLRIPHGAPLRELGTCVADIVTDEQPHSPTFATCQVTATEAAQDERPFKEPIHEAMVRGLVPDQDSALFVALDDAMGVLDDLTMNLAGRRLELEAHLDIHERSLHIASLVEALCGVDLDAVMPAYLAPATEARAQFTREAHELLDYEVRLRDMVDGDGDTLFVERTVERMRRAFREKWRTQPLREHWQVAVKHWSDTRLWRNDVRFDEARDFAATQTLAIERMQLHIDASERDLRAWLEHMGPKAEAFGYDTCQAEHSIELIDCIASLSLTLAASETGTAWLHEQFHTPRTLPGLALFNFNSELADMARRVSANFIHHGTLDEPGEQEDGSGHALEGPGDATSIASRTSELLSARTLKLSQLYKNLSNAGRAALEALRQANSKGAREGWELIGHLLLPTVGRSIGQPEQRMAFNVILLLGSTDLPESLAFHHLQNFNKRFETWQHWLRALQERIDENRQAVARPATPVQRHADRQRLAELEREMQEALARRPPRITGSAEDLPATDPRKGLIEHLGNHDLAHALKHQHNGGLERLGEAYKNLQKRTGGVLPLLVAGLNLWNLEDSARKAGRNGFFTANELRTVGANMAYTANALMALWTVPAWNRWAGLEAEYAENKTSRLVGKGANTWLKVDNPGFAKLSHRLIVRIFGMASFGAIAAGVEAWQVSNDVEKATSAEEETFLKSKLYMLHGLGGIAAGQAASAALGRWLSYSWIMSGPTAIIIATLGVIYLLSSLAANYLNREGLRLWLHRCDWGHQPMWSDNPEHFKRQLHIFLDICRTPEVVARGIYYPLDRRPAQRNGFWLQLLLPVDLPAPIIRLRPRMLDWGWERDKSLRAMAEDFYATFLDGHWVSPSAFKKLPPESPSEGSRLPGDVPYTMNHRHWVWQVWVDYPHKPKLEIEIQYPESAKISRPLHAYTFRLVIRHTPEKADRQGNSFDCLPASEKETYEKESLLSLRLPSRGNA